MGVAEDFAPSFTQKPQLRQEDEGNRLVFECQLLASPKPEIKWFRGDTELSEDNRTVFKIQPVGSNKFLVALELDDVVEEDAGLYKVKAKNKMGEVAASINLNFSPVDEPREKQIDGLAPTFTKKPAIRQEEDGKRLLFECRIQADPKPTVSWLHDGAVVKNSPRHKILLDKDGHSYFATLEIKNVTVEDAGKYKVTAKNELGESNATISLNFDSDEAPVPEDGIKPTFTERPVIRQSDDGTNITFECRCVGDPKPTVTWYHGKDQIQDGGRYKTSLTLDQKLYHMAKLEITNVENSDGGEYKAIAKNIHGEGVATINLNFEGGGKPKIPDGKPPRFPKKPTIRQEGETLIMECLLEANPLPDITWYQGTKVIADTNRVRMSRKATGKDTYLLTLEISSPTKEDGGNYRCNAFNSFGESNANISLNFQGGDDEGFAPTFVDKPRIIPNDSGTLITMKCKCKAKPNPIVTWYRGTNVVKESSKVKMKIIELGDDIYEIIMEIQDPTNADGGTYRCNAKNDYGESNANLNLNIEADQEPEGKEPIFVQKPRIVSEQNGKLVIMDCSVKADPAPTIVWYHGGKIVEKSSKVNISIEKKGEIYYIRLELKDPGKDDAGLYKCNIKNPFGELNANLTLNIEIVPVIKEKPKITKIIKKRTVIIECKVQSSFTPQCTWFKESKPVKEDSTHTVHVEQVKEGEFNVKLEIEQVSQKDKGPYKLVAKNDKGEATSQTVELTEIPEEKEEKVEKIQITESLTSIEVEEGKTARFSSSIKTVDKTVKVIWYKNAIIIKESKEYRITFDGQTAILEVLEVKKDSAGTYKVKFSNAVSEDSSAASLKVIEKKDEKKKKEEEEQKKKIEEKKEEKKVEEKKEEKKVEEKKEEKKVEEKKIEKKVEEKKEEKIIKKKEEEKKIEDKKNKEAEVNGAAIIEERRASVKQDRKASTIEERKASIMEERKGSIVEERKASLIEEKKAGTLEEKRASIKEKSIGLKVKKPGEETKPEERELISPDIKGDDISKIRKESISKPEEGAPRGEKIPSKPEEKPSAKDLRKPSIQEEKKIGIKDKENIKPEKRDSIKEPEKDESVPERKASVKLFGRDVRKDSVKEVKEGKPTDKDENVPERKGSVKVFGRDERKESIKEELKPTKPDEKLPERKGSVKLLAGEEKKDIKEIKEEKKITVEDRKRSTDDTVRVQKPEPEAKKPAEKPEEKKEPAKKEPEKLKNGVAPTSDRKPSIVTPKEETVKQEIRRESFAKPEDKRKATRRKFFKEVRP